MDDENGKAAKKRTEGGLEAIPEEPERLEDFEAYEESEEIRIHKQKKRIGALLDWTEKRDAWLYMDTYRLGLNRNADLLEALQEKHGDLHNRESLRIESDEKCTLDLIEANLKELHERRYLFLKNQREKVIANFK